MSKAFQDAVVACLLLSILTLICLCKVHVIRHKCPAAQLSKKDIRFLALAFSVGLLSCLSCMITWDMVIGTDPQTPYFSSWQAAEMLLVMAGTADIVSYLIILAVVENITYHRRASRRADAQLRAHDPLAKHSPVKTHRIWWTLRRRLIKTWR